MLTLSVLRVTIRVTRQCDNQYNWYRKKKGSAEPTPV